MQLEHSAYLLKPFLYANNKKVKYILKNATIFNTNNKDHAFFVSSFKELGKFKVIYQEKEFYRSVVANYVILEKPVTAPVIICADYFSKFFNVIRCMFPFITVFTDKDRTDFDVMFTLMKDNKEISYKIEGLTTKDFSCYQTNKNKILEEFMKFYKMV